jgi:nitrite reductase (NAD(P)H)
MKYDAKRQEYEIIVIGEEPHLAYNRVGLTTYFEHREVKKLYLNPLEWVNSISDTCRNIADAQIV